MTPQQMYLDALLEAISSEPFPSEDQRDMLLKLKEHFANTPDLTGELKRLYRVDSFSELAMSLMWVRQNAEKDTGRSEPTPDEQYFVSLKFRQAMGRGVPGLEPLGPVEAPEASVQEEPAPEPPNQVPLVEERPTVAYSPNAPEDTFPELLDKFVVASQTGVDDRTRLLEKVMNTAGEIGRPDSDYSSDLQEFCSKLVEFLSYARRNEFMDDVRTMNILSGVSDSMATWSAVSIESRAGLLTDGIKALADAQSHFE